MKCQSAIPSIVFYSGCFHHHCPVWTVQYEKNYKLGRDFTILEGSLSSLEIKCLSNHNAISMAVLQLQSYYYITQR